MTRVHIICEGQTEETFVKELLKPYFDGMGIYLKPALIGKPGHKGGRVKFARLFTDVRNRLLGDKSAYCTTFFDFYALPPDFPGKLTADTLNSIADKANAIHVGLIKAFEAKLDGVSLQRFIPYVQMHEYEGLLFSDPEKFANGIGRPSLCSKFQAIRDAFFSPEEINDDPMTAPSKRILHLVPEYEKPLYGTIAALEIGLQKIQGECKLFHDWMDKLESLKS